MNAADTLAQRSAVFETTIAGLVVRLEEGRGDNLEEAFRIPL